MLSHPNRSSLLRLVPWASVALVGACHDGGGGGGGGGGPVGPPQLIVDFALRTDVRLGTAFLGDLVHVDLDQDGIEDLVESNFGTKFVTIALGAVDGTFVTVHQLPTVGHAFQLATGDMDGDGLLDIAVASGDWVDNADRAVQVFLQGPLPGDFGAALTFDLATDPKGLCTAPVSGIAGGAGPAELFVALPELAHVLRLEVQAGALVETGTLDSGSIGIGNPFSVAAVDVGGDGWLDLVIGEDNPGTDRVVELPRNASGFQPAILVLEPVFKPLVDSTGDVDGNGFEDVAVAQVEDDSVLLLSGDASGLAGVSAIDFGGATTSLLFRDLDGDGLAEAIATVFLQESIQVRPGTGPMAWGDPVHYNVGLGPRALGVIEVPGDTIPDLLCANAHDLSLLFGIGGGRFRCARGTSTGAQAPLGVEAADLDGDGDLDAVAMTRFQETLVFLENLEGELVNSAEVELEPTGDDSGFFALGDVDQDGDVDVAATVTDQDELRIYRSGGDVASFRLPGSLEVIPVGDGPLGVDIGDLDDDGRMDVCVALVNAHAVVTLEGEGGGEFEIGTPLDLPFAPLNLQIVDVNGDGRLDVVTTGRDDAGKHLVGILGGDGRGNLGLRRAVSVPGVVANMATGDLDADGRLDIVLGHFDLATDEVVVLRNQGGFVFAEETASAGPGPGAPLLVDADEDGVLDLVVLSTGGELRIVRGDGTGRFLPEEARPGAVLSAADGVVGAAVADLDGDQLPELLMASTEAPFVWVAHNTSIAVPAD